MLEVVPARWQAAFDQLVANVQGHGIFAAPYITMLPIRRMVQLLPHRGVQLDVLTDLSSVEKGFTDPRALLYLLDKCPHTRIWYLPHLHAKVYIADEREAIVTSANLTEYGLNRNYEYGVRITDPGIVRRIRADLLEYKGLGNIVPREELERLIPVADRLDEIRQRMEQEVQQVLRRELQHQLEIVRTQLMEIRADRKTTNGIFADTILYLLRQHGPLTTAQLHPLIQQIHPDLCDDTIDRVIKGVHFGKLWKHYVRNAQQTLKRQGRIRFDGQRWQLIE